VTVLPAGKNRSLAAVPTYVWTLIALVLGILSGGLFPDLLQPLAVGTRGFIDVIILIVPVLIFAALAPSTATLIRRGLAGRFAACVIAWYALSSLAAGLVGLVIAAILFNIPLVAGTEGSVAEIRGLLRTMVSADDVGVSLPLVAIIVAVITAVIAVWVDRLNVFLKRIERGMALAGNYLGYVILPLILCFGTMIGVEFGATRGVTHYLTMIGYTAFICAVWWAFYVFVVIKVVTKRPVTPLITGYYVPTALFAAGTQSSLATLPVNLVNAKKYGIRDEVAEFVIPFGAVANMDASTLAYVAYAPFVTSYLFGIEMSWMMLLVAWPVVFLYSMAAPGLPAGLGTALWSSVLFASILGLEDPLRGDFIASWLALAGGIPDMFRSATNSTGDGFVAVVFDSLFERFFGARPSQAPALAGEGVTYDARR
jgi:Na+/H+-dicarboxylate symporter